MKRKSLLSIILVLSLVASLFAACGDKEAVEESATSTEESSTEVKETKEEKDTDAEDTAEAEASAKPYEGVTLKWAVSETAASSDEFIKLTEGIKEELGATVEFTIVPGSKEGEIDRTLVSLTAGDQLDIIYGATPKLKMYQSAGVLTSLNEYANNAGYDMDAVFGKNLPVFDGEVYGLPAYSDIWITYFNRQIFDDAGVPYPEAEGWTWEKYIETAKLLRNEGADIWGSFMLNYNNYFYMYATQKGVQPYKDDGTANFDDPAYREALEFFVGLGNTEGVQPTVTQIAAGEFPWNAFPSQDNLGMFVCGGWVTSLVKNHEKYPRDWDAGILPMPYPEGSQPSTLVINGNYAVPVTSAHKDAAFAAIAYMAENQYKLGYGRVPARIDLPEEEVTRYIEDELGVAFVDDGITVEDFRQGWFDPERIPYSEKIVGTADTSINQIWVEESQMYAMGAKTLDEAIASIQERANRAIEEAKMDQ